MRIYYNRFIIPSRQKKYIFVNNHTNHITHINTKLLKDSYHHAFLMKEQQKELKLLRCVL